VPSSEPTTNAVDPHAGEPARGAAPNSDRAIELRDIRLVLGGMDIYADVSFGVAPGELVCILGPSGCGKSTLLRLMGDLIQPSGGEILIGGRPAAAEWEKLAYVFQSPRLVPWRNALDNVMLARQLRFGKVDEAGRERAVGLLRLVGLENDGHKFPAMLSGGERQRVAIARALAVDPEIVLMDEPLSALDINTRQRLRREILQIWQVTGKTIVFVTHDVDDALALADRILLLSGKPSRLVDTIAIEEARPRRVEASPVLQAVRGRLEQMFADLEAH
jgi:NitT/TauT family transport system ATP-binding protein